jgi:hypothetical protein
MFLPNSINLTVLVCVVARRAPHGDAAHRQRRATTPQHRIRRPPVGHSSLSDALRRLPDAMASRYTPRLPERPDCPIKLTELDRNML